MSHTRSTAMLVSGVGWGGMDGIRCMGWGGWDGVGWSIMKYTIINGRDAKEIALSSKFSGTDWPNTHDTDSRKTHVHTR